MSVNLMSAIFQTEFRDLVDGNGNNTKASTAKLVLLAMADCANDEGEGAYPSIESLKNKCALSEQTIRNTFDALLYNGIIYRVGVSKHGTHNHTINTSSFPKAQNKRDFPPLVIGVNPLEGLTGNAGGSNEYLKGVNPLDPKHTINIQETEPPQNMPVEWYVAHGLEVPAHLTEQNNTNNNAVNEFERALGFGSLPWDSNRDWEAFRKWVCEIPQSEWQEYADWRKGRGKYDAMSNIKIRNNPRSFMDTGYPTFKAHSAMYDDDKPLRML